MKFLSIAIFILSFSVLAFSPKEMREVGMNPKSENQLALYSFLYEMALKNKLSGGKLLGESGVCFDFEIPEKKDGSGAENEDSFKLSVGLSNTSFERGQFGFTDKNSKQYKSMAKAISLTENFFKTARSKLTGEKGNPSTLSITGYSDSVHNDMDMFNVNDPSLTKVDNQDSIRTDSQKRNQLLAQERAKSFANTFFKGRNVNINGKNSYQLDRLQEKPKTKEENDKYACASRRRVVIDYNVDPSVSFAQAPQIYTPNFKTSKGDKQAQMVVSAVLDAGSYSDLSSLDKTCQGKSIQVFHEQAKAIKGSLEDNIKYRSDEIKDFSLEILKLCSRRNNPKLCDQEKLRKIKSSDLRSEQGIYEVASYFATLDKRDLSTHSVSQKFRDLFKKNERVISLSRCASLNKTRCNAGDWEKSGLRSKLNNQAYKYYIGHKFSSHFTGCFSNQAFYTSNFNDYTRRPGSLRDSKTGKMKINYSVDNIPTIKLKDSNGEAKVVSVAGKERFSEFKGHGCGASGHGSHYNPKTKRYDVFQRADNKDHKDDLRFATKNSSGVKNKNNVVEEAVAITNKFQGNTRVPGKFKMAEHMTPVIYVIKDCDPKNFESAQMIRMNQFNNNGEINKEIKIGENDCTFEPDIVSTCNAAPDGDHDYGEGTDGDKLLIYSLLAGKALETSLKGGLSSFIEKVNESIVNNCGEALPEHLKSENLINTIRCGKGDIAPLPTDNPAKDCPSVPGAQQYQASY